MLTEIHDNYFDISKECENLLSEISRQRKVPSHKIAGFQKLIDVKSLLEMQIMIYK